MAQNRWAWYELREGKDKKESNKEGSGELWGRKGSEEGRNNEGI